MARNKQVAENTQDIGYVLGKMEMLEKQLKDHQNHTDKQMEIMLDKLERLTSATAFWKHWVLVIKTIILTLPLIAMGNWSAVSSLWKDL